MWAIAKKIHTIEYMMSTPLVIREEDLPTWMRQANRRVDLGILIVIVISLAVAWSFIVFPGLPRNNATESYVFRAADTAATLKEGRLYPRWSPHALNGYGAPIPNYYPPAAPYAAAFVDVMFTGDTVLAVRLVFILSLLFAGSMVYVLVMRRVNAASGILAAILYVYSPYVGLTAPHLTGDLTDVLCLALVPMLLWAVNRLLYRHQPIDFALVVFTSAALLMAQPAQWLTGILFAGLLVAIYYFDLKPRRPFMIVIGALAVSICLAAIYWLPALAEMDAVTWADSPVNVPSLALHLGEFFQPAGQIDPSAMLNVPQFTIGTAALLFGAASAGVMLWQKPSGIRFQWLFLITGAALIPFALFVAPHATWLTGMINLCLAIGGSGVLYARNRLTESGGRIYLAALLIVAILMAIPVWFTTTPREDSGAFSPAAQIRFEQQGYGIAVLPPGAPVPTTLQPNTPVSRLLVNGYTSDNVNRFSDNPTLQNSASVLLEGTHIHQFQVRSIENTVVTLLNAYFPGWQAYLSGVPLTTAAAPQTGLVEVVLPRVVDGDFVLILTDTPPRTAASVVSGLALIVTILITMLRFRRSQPALYQRLHLLSPAEARLIAVVLALLGGLAFLSYQSIVPLQIRAQGQYALRDGTLLRSRSDAGLEAYYYRLDKTDYQRGGTIELTLYWQASQLLSANYKTSLSLRDISTGSTWYMTEPRHPGFYPARRWLRNMYVPDSYSIPISPDAPAGRYVIAIEVYRCDPDCNPDNRLNFFASNGNPVGPVLTLPRILIVN
jgi:hypothetical protein